MRVEMTGNILTDECITVSEAKLWAKIDLATDDDIVEELIVAARRYAEGYVNTAILPQDVILWLDALEATRSLGEMYWRSGSRYINVDYGIPMRLGDFRIFDEDGNPTVWNPNNYVLQGSRVVLNTEIPFDLRDNEAISIAYVAGYGTYNEDDDTWIETVPQDIKIAMKMLIAHYYQNRQAAVEGQLTSIPFGATAILDRYRVYAL